MSLLRDAASRAIYLTNALFLPKNHTAYTTVLTRHVSDTCLQHVFAEVQDLLRSDRERRSAWRVASSLLVVSPELSDLPFFPYMCVAISRCVPSSPHVAHEIALHLLVNIFGNWTSQAPASPGEELSRMDEMFRQIEKSVSDRDAPNSCEPSRISERSHSDSVISNVALESLLKGDFFESSRVEFSKSPQLPKNTHLRLWDHLNFVCGSSAHDYLWLPLQTFFLYSVGAEEWLPLFCFLISGMRLDQNSRDHMPTQEAATIQSRHAFRCSAIAWVFHRRAELFRCFTREAVHQCLTPFASSSIRSTADRKRKGSFMKTLHTVFLSIPHDEPKPVTCLPSTGYHYPRIVVGGGVALTVSSGAMCLEDIEASESALKRQLQNELNCAEAALRNSVFHRASPVHADPEPEVLRQFSSGSQRTDVVMHNKRRQPPSPAKPHDYEVGDDHNATTEVTPERDENKTFLPDEVVEIASHLMLSYKRRAMEISSIQQNKVSVSESILFNDGGNWFVRIPSSRESSLSQPIPQASHETPSVGGTKASTKGTTTLGGRGTSRASSAVVAAETAVSRRSPRGILKK